MEVAAYTFLKQLNLLFTEVTNTLCAICTLSPGVFPHSY